MGFEKITSLSLTDLFVQQVENMILSGELAPGDKLPPERELCTRMGVSRPVVSAGLTQLEKLGFVTVAPRQGVTVCDYRRKGTLETLVAIMRYNGGVMRADEIRSLMQVRTPLESLAVELVINHAADAELDALAPLLEVVAAAAQRSDISATAQAVFAFYHELAVLSGNVLLPLLYHSFRPMAMYLWQLFCRDHGCRQLYEKKLQLYKALLNRDLPAALQLTPGEYPRDIEAYVWP